MSAGRGGGFQRVYGTSLSWSPSLKPGCLSLCLGPCQASSRHMAVAVGCARTQPPRPPSLRTPSTLSVSLGPDPWNSPTLLSPARTHRSAAHSAHTVSGGSAASQAQRRRPACLVTRPVRDTGLLPGDCPPAVAPGGRHVCALSGVHTQAPNTACDADHPPRERAATHTHTGALTHMLAALQHPQMLSLPQFLHAPGRQMHGGTSSPEAGPREAPRGPPPTQDPFHTQTHALGSLEKRDGNKAPQVHGAVACAPWGPQKHPSGAVGSITLPSSPPPTQDPFRPPEPSTSLERGDLHWDARSTAAQAGVATAE